jgi:hypothetical protein
VLKDGLDSFSTDTCGFLPLGAPSENFKLDLVPIPVNLSPHNDSDKTAVIEHVRAETASHESL